MKEEFSAFYQFHQFIRNAGIQPVSLNQKTQHRPESNCHGDHGVILLGQYRVIGNGRG